MLTLRFGDRTFHSPSGKAVTFNCNYSRIYLFNFQLNRRNFTDAIIAEQGIYTVTLIPKKAGDRI
ncbi:hypothetical protein [Aerosakkonema funiforme]|uniref:hypothetical protein n=1 Tax=Aerosakkonema funiforme TaxID=1246630 RepID=UPI0035B6D310